MYNKENGRKNMRLQGYDYSRAGLYFLTIVIQNRWHLFGQVQNGKMILNDAGRMVEKWHREIEHKYPDKHCHEMVVMPNHFHCIIENTDAPVRAPLRGRPNPNPNPNPDPNPNPNTNHNNNNNNNNNNNPKYGMHNQKYGATIGDVMDWFKTMTTNEYIRGVKNNNWRRFDGKLWQRNFYDHIIRNRLGYERISNYIHANPEKWNDDKFNKE